jgi:hypothetical protein
MNILLVCNLNTNQKLTLECRWVEFKYSTVCEHTFIHLYIDVNKSSIRGKGEKAEFKKRAAWGAESGNAEIIPTVPPCIFRTIPFRISGCEW